MLIKTYAHEISPWREAFQQGDIIVAFSIPYTDCHRHFRNTCYVYFVNLTSSPLNYVHIKFQSVFAFFALFFFPCDSLPSFIEHCMRSSSKARPCINGMSFVNCVCKMYSSVLSHCPPHAWQNQELLSAHALEAQELLKHLVK